MTHRSTTPPHADHMNAEKVQVSFDVQVDHPVVLANGRQQSRVRFGVSMTVGGAVTMPTPDEWASIRVIAYDGGDPLPLDDDDVNDGWSSQRRHRGYRFGEPGALSAPASPGVDAMPTPSAFTNIDLYVSAGEDQANMRLTIAFSFDSRDGWRYRTNGYATSPMGEDIYYAQNDLDRHQVQAAPAPQYQPGQITLNGQRQPLPIDDMVVTLSLPVPIRRIDCDPPGMIHWRNQMGDAPCFTGFASAGDTAYQWMTPLPPSSTPLPRPNGTVRLATIVVCARNDVPIADNPNMPRGPIALAVLDDYGTTSRFMVRLDDTDRGKLVVY
ncbi:hypothetical protein PI246_03000 [Luteibacter sp. PPL193]|nr:hypothetical protein [Luteibacter sp. PPL193]